MKPELGVCYYPVQWAEDVWKTDAQRMVEAGISWVRIGEFSWSRLEPQEGSFQWGWLDRAVTILGEAGLKIVMGTPTATPPMWVLKKYPDMLGVDKEGRERKFGSRRHYCFSHLPYRKEAARISGDMAQRYGKNPFVHLWQIDNEYACHDTTLSYSKAALNGFRVWLEEKYQSIEVLNSAWGNVFWSMEYLEFEEIDLPNLTVTEPNPAHVMDFKRYSSDQVVAFNFAQVEALRAHTQVACTHNYMGRTLDFDHFKVGEDLEVASWDSYPMGFLEDRSDEGEDWKTHFAQQGDPDFQAFHHDLYRAVGKGRWWVMEQQPGPVNWAPWNPIPLDGMVRLWAWEAIAHGAEVVSYFRWRQAPFAQEQMHAALLRSDGVEAQAYKEVQQLAQELSTLESTQSYCSDVALVFDYESAWAWETQPHGKDFDYFRLIFDFYRALRRLGLSVDILPPNCEDFGNRKMVVIPALMRWNDKIRQAIRTFDGRILYGPRTGSKTQNMSIPTSLPPEIEEIDVKVSRVGSLRPTIKMPLEKKGAVVRWFEELEGGPVLLSTQTGKPVLVGTSKRAYLGAWLDKDGLEDVLEDFVSQAGLDIKKMPEGVRRRQSESRCYYFNYNAESVTVDGIEIAGGDLWIEKNNASN